MASSRGKDGDVVFHPLVHGLIAWALAHLVATDRRTRLWCVIAALVPDLDGLGIIFGPQVYQRYHHVLTHNVFFGLAVTVVSARWIGRRPAALVLVLASFLSHVVGDYFGSGEGWSLWPFWPLSSFEVLNPHAWPFVSWQNNVIGFTSVAVTLIIAVRWGRTPLEFFSPGLDRSVVDALRLRVRATPCATCESRATARCHACGRAVCRQHVATPTYRHLVCAGCPAV